VNKLIALEHNRQRVLTTTQLAESYGAEAQVLTNNFNRNKERYVFGKHYYLLEGEELRDFKAINQIDLLPNVNRLYLWTEKGAWLHAKSLNTDKAWEAYEMLVDEYYRIKDTTPQLSQLSPELQMATQLLQAMAKVELEQKQLTERVDKTEAKISVVKETLIQRDDNWRKSINSMLNKIAKTNRDYQQKKTESYMLLEKRASCDLSTRLRNLKDRLQREGATKTKVNQANRLDVIEADKRLKEIYTSIVKEMTIAYTV
jgi:hypothetical protein